MCFHTIDIPNPAKSFSRVFSDRLILSVPCGHCVECQTKNANEWYYRAMAEWKHCVSTGGFVLMDCLTYRPKSVPFFSDYLDEQEKKNLPAELDFMCFSHRDIRLFRELLHNRLCRAGFDVNNDNFRFFLSSEYGTADEYTDDRGRKRKGTHRPHYHLLFFCNVPKLKPVRLSMAISDAWPHGTTDGVIDKGARYVLDEKVFRGDIGASSSVSRYVTKYVQKDSEFEEEIQKRISSLVRFYASQSVGSHYSKPRVTWSLGGSVDSVDGCSVSSVSVVDDNSELVSEYLRSVAGKRMKAKIVRAVDQFHRQSTNFGACAIDGFDIDYIMERGVLHVDDKDKVVLTINLPLYYKRKLFYKCVVLNGVKTWIPTELGDKYNSLSRERSVYYIAAKYRAKAFEIGCHCDCDFDALARYIVYKRGRSLGSVEADSNAYQRSISFQVWYSYSSDNDLLHFGGRFVSSKYLGNNIIGYHGSLYNDISVVPFRNFIDEHSYFDEHFENVLSVLNNVVASHGDGKQRANSLQQRSTKVFKKWR